MAEGSRGVSAKKGVDVMLSRPEGFVAGVMSLMASMVLRERTEPKTYQWPGD